MRTTMKATSLITAAITELATCETNTLRAIKSAYAIGLIEMAYACGLLTDVMYDGFNAEMHEVELKSRVGN